MARALTREQVRTVDRIAIEKYGISGLVLMENAGRSAAAIMRDYWRSRPPESVVIFCGMGNNGGDGFVIARHLVNGGTDVQIGLAGDADRLTPDSEANHRICLAMGIPIDPADDVAIGDGDWVVDALLGTGFSGDVRTPMARVIDRINVTSKRGVVAVDLPSGLDCDTGQPSNATIEADLTVTFVGEKAGFGAAEAKPYVGCVRVADIGAPVCIVRRVLES